MCIRMRIILWSMILSSYSSADDALTHHQRALEFDKNDQLEQAFREWELAVEADPKFVKAYYNLGVCYVRKEKYNDAILNFKKTIELDPKFADAYYMVGALNANYLNEDEQAIQYFFKLIEINPEYIRAYTALAIIYENKGNYELASKFRQKATEVNLKGCLNTSSWLYNYEKDFKLSLIQGKEELKSSPDSIMAHFNMAFIYYRTGLLDQSITEWEKVLEMYPECISAYIYLGKIYRTKNMLSQAINSHLQALKIDSIHPGILYNLGLDYMLMSYKEEIMGNDKEAKELEEKSLFYFKKAYRQSGPLWVGGWDWIPSGVFAFYERAKEENLTAYALFYMAQLYANECIITQNLPFDKYIKIIYFLQKVVMEYPGNELSNNAQGIINSIFQYDLPKEDERTIKTCQRIMELFPASETSSRALFLIGEVYNELKNYEMAINTFQKVVENYPKETQKAIEEYLKVVENYQNDDLSAKALFSIVEIYQNKKDSQKVIEVLERISNNYPKYTGEALFSIAKIYREKKDYKNAIETLNKIIHQLPKSEDAAQSQFLIGEIYHEQKDYKQAEIEYHKVTQIYPQSKFVYLARGGLEEIKHRGKLCGFPVVDTPCFNELYLCVKISNPTRAFDKKNIAYIKTIVSNPCGFLPIWSDDVSRHLRFDYYLVILSLKDKREIYRKKLPIKEGEIHITSSPKSKMFAYSIRNENFPKGEIWLIDLRKIFKCKIYKLVDGINPDWSADGTKIIYENEGIWMINIDGSNNRKILSEGYRPICSPCGTMVATNKGIYKIETAEKICEIPIDNGYLDWSSDGKKLLVCPDSITFNISAPALREVYIIDLKSCKYEKLLIEFPAYFLHSLWKEQSVDLSLSYRINGVTYSIDDTKIVIGIIEIEENRLGIINLNNRIIEEEMIIGP